jgi:hypothetical protein
MCSTSVNGKRNILKFSCDRIYETTVIAVLTAELSWIQLGRLQSCLMSGDTKPFVYIMLPYFMCLFYWFNNNIYDGVCEAEKIILHRKEGSLTKFMLSVLTWKEFTYQTSNCKHPIMLFTLKVSNVIPHLSSMDSRATILSPFSRNAPISLNLSFFDCSCS